MQKRLTQAQREAEVWMAVTVPCDLHRIIGLDAAAVVERDPKEAARWERAICKVMRRVDALVDRARARAGEYAPPAEA